MSAHLTHAYLALPADDRVEIALPATLKRQAEAMARARGETLSEYVRHVLAERVANEIGMTDEWRLTTAEQTELLHILAEPAPPTVALRAATLRAERQFGV